MQFLFKLYLSCKKQKIICITEFTSYLGSHAVDKLLYINTVVLFNKIYFKLVRIEKKSDRFENKNAENRML